jgi:hypothetical protein
MAQSSFPVRVRVRAQHEKGQDKNTSKDEKQDHTHDKATTGIR